MARFFYDGELPFKINADIIGCAAAIGAGGNTHFGRKVLIKAIACADGDGLHAKRLHASTTYAFLAMDVYAFGEESVAV